MRAFVFTDPALTSRAGQFVWLDLNLDDERNAALQERLGVEAFPTYFVMKPDDETVAFRVVGAMTVAEIVTFLDDARAALGIPEGTARSDLHHARARLRQELGPVRSHL